MTDRYVKSGAGNSSPYANWTNAATTLAAAFAVAAPGDTIYVSKAHTESQGSLMNLVSPGTLANPVYIIGVDDTGNPVPPTATATGAIIGSTSGWGLTFRGVAYSYKVDYTCDRSNSNFAAIFGVDPDAVTSPGSCFWYFDSCNLIQGSINAGSPIQIGEPNSSIGYKQASAVFKNCVVKFNNASQKLAALGNLDWIGGSLNVAAAVPTTLLALGVGSDLSTPQVNIRGVDLSGLGSNALVDVSGSPQGFASIANCKIASGTVVTTGTFSGMSGPNVEMDNCDSGATNYRSSRNTPVGSVVTETTKVRTGGASNGTTSLAWKMVTGSNAKFPAFALATKEMAIWNDTTGASKTLTVEFLHDSVTALTNGDIWLELQYLGSSGSPVSTFLSNAKADVLASASNHSSSSATWTTTGLTNPNKQALSVTFTPQSKGYLQVKVYLSKASYTVYVDPKLTVV